MQLEHLLTEYARGLREQTPRLEVCSGERVFRCSGARWEGDQVKRCGRWRVFRWEDFSPNKLTCIHILPPKLAKPQNWEAGKNVKKAGTA